MISKERACMKKLNLLDFNTLTEKRNQKASRHCYRFPLKITKKYEDGKILTALIQTENNDQSL